MEIFPKYPTFAFFHFTDVLPPLNPLSQLFPLQVSRNSTQFARPSSNTIPPELRFFSTSHPKCFFKAFKKPLKAHLELHYLARLTNIGVPVPSKYEFSHSTVIPVVYTEAFIVLCI